MKYAETPCSHEKFPRALFPGKKEKKRNCPWCPKVITASNLSRHIRRVHKTELRGEVPRRTKLAGASYAVSPARKEETLRQGPKLVIRPQEGTVRLNDGDAYVEDAYDRDACGCMSGGDEIEIEIELAESELNRKLAELYSGRVSLKPTTPTLKYEVDARVVETHVVDIHMVDTQVVELRVVETRMVDLRVVETSFQVTVCTLMNIKLQKL